MMKKRHVTTTTRVNHHHHHHHHHPTTTTTTTSSTFRNKNNNNIENFPATTTTATATTTTTTRNVMNGNSVSASVSNRRRIMNRNNHHKMNHDTNNSSSNSNSFNWDSSNPIFRMYGGAQQQQEQSVTTTTTTSSSFHSKSSSCQPSFSTATTGTKMKEIETNGHGVDDGNDNGVGHGNGVEEKEEHSDMYNYALLIALYTLQGVPMGLSASIPFLIQQKVKTMSSSTSASSLAKLSYNSQAVFALCSWPFSLKLLWAPIVDAVFFQRFGRRKSWLIPVQMLAGIMMVMGSDYVETQLGLSSTTSTTTSSTTSMLDVRGVTAFFFALYFLMATQDIAVDGWALTMLSRKNRGKGPICNSIGQNLGYFFSFAGFLALNDAESSENLWRPLFGMPSSPGVGLVSLGGFIRFMGCTMLVITTFVAIFKREGVENHYHPIHNLKINNNHNHNHKLNNNKINNNKRYPLLGNDKEEKANDNDEEEELDAYQIGLAETYHRLWETCKLPAVRWLFLILLTYRLPTALSDNVKFLKAVEFGLSKQTTALLSPTLILPLGIAVPIIASKIWHGHPLRQFMTAYKIRVTLVAFLDALMLLVVRRSHSNSSSSSSSQTTLLFWSSIISSTGLQAIVHSLQFNAQMTFFASRVDPAIGGSYMTLLNTAANLGGTWPASFVMYLMGQLTIPPTCIPQPSTSSSSSTTSSEVCTGGRDAYFPLQVAFSILGCTWIYFLGNRVAKIATLPDEAWRTHSLTNNNNDHEDKDVEKQQKGKGKGKDKGGKQQHGRTPTNNRFSSFWPFGGGHTSSSSSRSKDDDSHKKK